MATLREIQAVIGQELLPEARAAQTSVFSEEQTLPVALELFYLAFAMKAAHQPGALFVARRYAARMGLDEVQVEQFAMQRLSEALAAE